MIIKNYFYLQHPINIILYFGGVIILSMSVSGPFLTAISLLCSLLSVACAKGVKQLLSAVKTVIPVILILTAVNPLVNTKGLTVLFTFFSRPVTVEALLYGLSSGFALASVIVWFILFNEMNGSDALVELLAGKLPNISLSLIMILRYIPYLIKSADNAAGVRAVLCGEENSKKDRLKNALDVSTAVMEKSLEDSVETAKSMNARGYSDCKKRTGAFVFSKTDGKFLGVILCVFIFSSCLIILNGRFSFYPYVDIPKYTFLACAVYAFFLLLPVLSDGKDLILCRFSK